MNKDVMMGSALCTLALCLGSGDLWAQRISSAQNQSTPSYVRGEVLAMPLFGARLAVARSFAFSGMTILEQDAVSGLMRVAVPPGEELAWCQALSQWPALSFAELNGIGQGGEVPDDTHYPSQWHLLNTTQNSGTPGADIEAEAAWEITTGSSTIVVAVLDSGIDSDHPEFAGRIDPDGRDFVDEDRDPEADHPHGTWVSGVLGANANNGFATVGVDWSCRILPIKVLNANNRGATFDLAQGLNYVSRQADVQVVCMSLINYPQSQALRNAIARARNAGKILMACAGNGGRGDANASYPGSSPLTISIGATTSTDARASFSGTGRPLDFVAPGQSIVTARHNSSNDSFSVVSGCSFATPIATGVVSLLLAAAEERGLSLDQDEVYELLREGAEDQVGRPGEDAPGRDNFHGHGRLNALRSLQALPLVLSLDIKPGACPNPLNPSSQGKLPVALLGSPGLDLQAVDVLGVQLSRADGVGASVSPNEGPPGPRSVFADVGTPYTGAPGGCHGLGADGVLDLSMKFLTAEVVRALELDQLAPGASVELVLSGVLNDGQHFIASDHVSLVPVATGALEPASKLGTSSGL